MDAAPPATGRRDSGRADRRARSGAAAAGVRRKCEDLLIDVVGLCLTARNEDYVKAALAGWDDEGAVHRDRPCAHA